VKKQKRMSQKGQVVKYVTDTQKQAYRDYKNGMKYAEIAAKYKVSISTVKMWAKRHWKNKINAKVTAEKAKKVTNSQPRQKGGQTGNINTVKHGAYRKVFDGFLDEEEQSLLADISKEPEDVLLDELELHTVRERWFLEQIVQIKHEYAKDKKLMLNTVTKIVGESNNGYENKTITEATAAFNFLKVLEMELTKVQAQKMKCAIELAKLKSEKEIKLKIVSETFTPLLLVEDK
jgi:hypothetical protein